MRWAVHGGPVPVDGHASSTRVAAPARSCCMQQSRAAVAGGARAGPVAPAFFSMSRWRSAEMSLAALAPGRDLLPHGAMLSCQQMPL